MIDYPKLSPDIVSLGPLKIRWYGFMYVVAYALGFFLLKRRARLGLIRVNYRACEMWISYMVVSMLIGARLAYVFLYNWHYYQDHLVELFYIWEGGLSFHGAAVGMTVGCALFARRFGLSFFEVTDCLAFCSAPGLFFGRLGNFINGELYGRPASVAWAMIFPRDPSQVPRHPSQLYEAFAEGLLGVLFVWGLEVWMLKKSRFRSGVISGSFLMFYGIARFLIEYTREPDAQLGLLWASLSMGQWLCAIMVICGAGVLFTALKTQKIRNIQSASKEFLEEEKPASQLTTG